MNEAIQRIINGHGIAISIVSMLIVFLALSLISLFITLLPRILDLIAKVFPENEQQSNTPPVDDQIIAAIGFALHKRNCTRK